MRKRTFARDIQLEQMRNISDHLFGKSFVHDLMFIGSAFSMKDKNFCCSRCFPACCCRRTDCFFLCSFSRMCVRYFPRSVAYFILHCVSRGKHRHKTGKRLPPPPPLPRSLFRYGAVATPKGKRLAENWILGGSHSRALNILAAESEAPLRTYRLH